MVANSHKTADFVVVHKLSFRKGLFAYRFAIQLYATRYICLRGVELIAELNKLGLLRREGNSTLCAFRLTKYVNPVRFRSRQALKDPSLRYGTPQVIVFKGGQLGVIHFPANRASSPPSARNPDSHRQAAVHWRSPAVLPARRASVFLPAHTHSCARWQCAAPRP